MPEAPEFTRCPNCGAEVVGKFCAACGQRIADVKVGVKPLFLDLLEDQFSLGSALPRTIKALFIHPGKLTTEYLSLRIARYVAPFRLYLISSLILFVLLSFFTQNRMVVNNNMNVTMDSVTAALKSAEDSTRNALAGSTSPIAAANARRDSIALAGDSAARALKLSKRCGRFGNSNAMSAAAPAKRDSLKGVQVAFSSDSAVLFGLRAEPEHSNWAEYAQVQLGNERINKAVCVRLLALGDLPPDVAFRRLMLQVVHSIPKIMFLVLPLYALLLKLLYVRRKRYYVEHFVFALHVHAFTFLLFTAMFLLRSVSVLPALLWCWLPVYTLIAMKRVYGQGWLKTSAKWLVLGCIYFFIVMFAGITVFVGAILTA